MNKRRWIPFFNGMTEDKIKNLTGIYDILAYHKTIFVKLMIKLTT